MPRPPAPLGAPAEHPARGRDRGERARAPGGRTPRPPAAARRRAAGPLGALFRAARGARSCALPRDALRENRKGARHQRRRGENADLPGHGDAQGPFLRRRLVMECRQALKIRDLVLVRLAGSQGREGDMAFLASHLASCAACRAEAAGIESVWARLGDDDGADLAPSAAFVARGGASPAPAAGCVARASAAPADANRENVVPFRARRATDGLLKAAALLLAGGLGFLVGRSGVSPLPLVGSAALPTPNGRGENVALVSIRTLDASRAVLDLSGKPRLANATYRASEEPGKIAVSFDVTTRYTVVGRPEEKGVADLLVSLMSGAAETEGARARVLDFVSATTREGGAVSPEIVSLLRRTLEA